MLLDSILFRMQVAVNELESLRDKEGSSPSIINALVSLREAIIFIKKFGAVAPQAKIGR